jgi:hypothetical protein
LPSINVATIHLVKCSTKNAVATTVLVKMSQMVLLEMKTGGDYLILTYRGSFG